MTDSQTSLHMIARAINAPHDLTEHRHNALLRSIADAIERSAGTVHLYKVAAHAGIIGNEAADAIAVALAKGERPENTHTSIPLSRSGWSPKATTGRRKFGCEPATDRNNQPPHPQAAAGAQRRRPQR
jgi:hypothetical protein